MIKILGGPRSGKTYDLIKRSSEGWFYIVCFDQDECIRVKKMAKGMGLDIPMPISFQAFIEGSFYAPGCKGFLIDNLDYLVKDLAKGVPIEAVTMDSKDVHSKNVANPYATQEMKDMLEE